MMSAFLGVAEENMLVFFADKEKNASRGNEFTNLLEIMKKTAFIILFVCSTSGQELQ